MAQKRLRIEFESDLHSHDCAYVLYGTPLPPLNNTSRDDGSYVPLWKQEVKDERGRKRLHGAFTGGFSAGYFNTVGSKEGWTPSSFVSSRSDKYKKEIATEHERRTQFMDEEDLAEAAEEQKLFTNSNFKELGLTVDERDGLNFHTDDLEAAHENVGEQLLRKLGWTGVKDVRSTDQQRPGLINGKTSSFIATPAYRNLHVLTTASQTSFKGLDLDCGVRSRKSLMQRVNETTGSHTEPARTCTRGRKTKLNSKQPNKGPAQSIVDDYDPDDDTDAMGPKILYKTLATSDLKIRKATVHDKSPTKSANVLVNAKLLHKPTKNETRVKNLQKHIDGRTALKGFISSEMLTEAADTSTSSELFASLVAPTGWVSSRGITSSDIADFGALGDTTTSPKHDARSRASLLGEAALPGKSVFAFISSTSRNRLAAITGRHDLPIGLGEIPAQTGAQDVALDVTIPALEKEIAQAALGRGDKGWTPYADDEAKRTRYRSFMEYCANKRPQLPDKPSGMTSKNFLDELREFVQAAVVFRPISGTMSSRFTASSGPSSDADKDTIHFPTTNTQLDVENAAKNAAQLGIFGPLTRHSFRFSPTSLVCKRFGIMASVHVQQQNTEDHSDQKVGNETSRSYSVQELSLGKQDTGSEANKAVRKSLDVLSQATSAEADGGSASATELSQLRETAIDPSYNSALEAEKAGEALFQTIFGDDSDDYK